MLRAVMGTVCLALAWAGPVVGGPALKLTDVGLPVRELRPLDRHVYALTLDGVWEGRPEADQVYHLQLRFPDGTTHPQRLQGDLLVRTGEVRCVIQDYLIQRHGLSRGGPLVLYVTARKGPTDKPEVISNELELSWPLKRPVQQAPAAKAAPRPLADVPFADVPPVGKPPAKESAPKPDAPKPAPPALSGRKNEG